MERCLDRQVVYAGRVLSVRRDRVALAGGREAVREVVEYPPVVAVVPLLPDGRVVLVRQFRYAVGAELLEIPAGKMRPGEAREDAARRELREETGYEAGCLTYLGSAFSTPGFTEEEIHFFLAEGLVAGEPDPDEDEVVRAEVVPLEAALAWTRDGMLRDLKSLAGLSLASAHLQARQV